MTRPSGAPDASVVIEWEHVSVGAADRAIAMLRRLTDEIARLEREVEVVIVSDPDNTDRAELGAILERAGSTLSDVHLVEGSGLRYYGLKNLGAERCGGRIVVFLDSDVIPEPGWLRAILDPFRDESVEVVAGNVYIGPLDATYRKAFALFWLFNHLDRQDAPPAGQRLYHANDVAFRRETILRVPWPRGVRLSPNMEHARAIVEDGATAAFAAEARALHPTPEGLEEMCVYAFSSGYDRAFPLMSGGGIGRRLLTFLAVPFGFLVDVARSAALILPRGRRRAVGLRLLEIPLALGLAAFYALLKSLGHLVSVVFPDAIPSRWSTGSSLAGSHRKSSRRAARSAADGP